MSPLYSGANVTVTTGDIELGSIELKDAATDNRARVTNATPDQTDYGVVVRDVNNFAQTEVVILGSGARTTDQTQADQTNYKFKGVHLVVDVTSAGTGSITPKIQGRAGGIYYDILVGSAITTTGTNVLKIYPGLTPVANGVASDVIPRIYRVIITHNNANSMTYSVAAQFLI